MAINACQRSAAEQHRFLCGASFFTRGTKGLLFWVAMGSLLVANPLIADVRVAVDRIWAADARGVEKGEFLPGEIVQYGVWLRILDLATGSLSVRLRIMGDGWYETMERRVFPGFQQVIWGADGSLRTSSEACEGKVALHVDVQWEDPDRQERIEIEGDRHAYLSVRCEAGGFPRSLIGHVQVGQGPSAMAFTQDNRYLYVSCKEGRSIFVVRTDPPYEVVAEISDPDKIGEPTGIALAPNRTDMLVADYTMQKIHILDTVNHTRKDSVSIEGEFGRVWMGDLAVNVLRNEIYVADVADSRILAINGQTYSARAFPLSGSTPSGFAVGLNPVKILIDPQGFLYVLCAGLGEVLKLEPNLGGLFASYTKVSVPCSSMAFNASQTLLYVVRPGIPEVPPIYGDVASVIYVLNSSNLSSVKNFKVGPGIFDLLVRPDGRFAYGIDAARGQLVMIDLDAGLELAACAAEVGYGGRLLLKDPRSSNRIFIGAVAPSAVEIVE